MKIVYRFLVLLGILSILIAMRFHFLEEPFERDEGCYSYMGWRMLNGDIIYKDFWDTKPPGIVCIYSLIFKYYGASFTAVRVLTLFFGLITTILIYLLGEKLFDTKTGLLSSLLYAVFSGGPLIQGSSANCETFMVLFSISGLYLYLLSVHPPSLSPLTTHALSVGTPGERACEARVRGYTFVFLSGILFGFGTIIKPLAFDGLLTVCIFTLIFGNKKIKKLFLIFLGFFAAWIPTLLYLIKNNVLKEFLYAVFSCNISYVKYGHSLSYFQRLINSFIYINQENSLLWLLGFTAVIIMLIKERGRKNILAILWLFFSIIAISISGMFFPHYFIQIIPVLSILSAYTLNRLFKEEGLMAKSAGIFSLITIIFICIITFLNVYRYYLVYNPYEVCMAKYPTEKFVLTEPLGKEINKITNPNDYIYVWGSEPGIYFFAQRRCSVRFINNYFMKFKPETAQERKKEIMESLRLNKPKVILVFDSLDLFPELKDFLKDYEKGQLYGIPIYRI